jgi:GT2 family glycosyltransferase
VGGKFNIINQEDTVTVVLVNYRSAVYIKHTLKDLLAQTHPPDKIILVNNSPNTDKFDSLASIPILEVLTPQKNIGFAAGNNLGILKSDTKYVALLNPDAFPDSDWLKNLLLGAKNYPEYHFFGSRQMVYGATNFLDGTGDCVHISGAVWRSRYFKTLQSSDLIPREIFCPCAAAALYRREILLEADGFDETFFCYVEDVDLGFRLRTLGYKAMYIPDAIVYHVGGGSSGGTSSDFAIYHGHRNLVWMFVKNMPFILLVVFLPIHLLFQFVSIFYYTYKGKGEIIFKSKFDALKNISTAISARKKVQLHRKISIFKLLQSLSWKWKN